MPHAVETRLGGSADVIDDLARFGEVLAVVAHPDDESFGLGAVLAALGANGAETRVLCFTHGEATAQTGATFQGRLLARDGAVTLDTNTITRAACAPPEGTTTTTGGGGTTSTTVVGGPTTTIGGGGERTTTTPGLGGGSSGGAGTSSGESGGPGSGSGRTTSRTTSSAVPLLPYTGAETTLLAAVGLALVTFGAVLLSTRRPALH